MSSEERDKVNGSELEDDCSNVLHETTNYKTRLENFYRLYNPRNVIRVREYLSEYKGKEELLFAILTKKYGPEPSEQAIENNENCPQFTSKYNLSAESESVIHYSGKKFRIPKFVSAEEGNTDCETPYWANRSSLISDRDLIKLLRYNQTDNQELQRCYMGILPQHPHECWNGMVYLTNEIVNLSANDIFLGHYWAATLSSNKVLMYEQKRYYRTTLYCTDVCQHSSKHERWRLSIYRSENNSTLLLRSMWDPLIVPEPLPLTQSQCEQKNTWLSTEEFQSTRVSSYSESSSISEEALNESRDDFCIQHTSCNNKLQPKQPSLITAVAELKKIVQDIDTRLSLRLDALERRIEKLEK